MRELVQKFAACERGATAIEYGLIAAATGLALIATMPTLNSELGEKYTDINAAVENAANGYK